MKLQGMIKLFVTVLVLGLVAMLSTANVLAAELALEEEGATIEEEQQTREPDYDLPVVEEDDLISEENYEFVTLESIYEEIVATSNRSIIVNNTNGRINLNGNLANVNVVVGEGGIFAESTNISWQNGAPVSSNPAFIVGGHVNTSVAGVYTITVSFEDLSDTFVVEVIDMMLVMSSITVSVGNIPQPYNPGGHTVSADSIWNIPIYIVDRNNPERIIQRIDRMRYWGFYNWMDWNVPGVNLMVPGVYETTFVLPDSWFGGGSPISTTFTVTVVGEEPPNEGGNNQTTNDSGNRQVSPQTGDTANVAGFGITALLSLLVLVITAHMKRKRIG